MNILPTSLTTKTEHKTMTKKKTNGRTARAANIYNTQYTQYQRKTELLKTTIEQLRQPHEVGHKTGTSRRQPKLFPLAIMYAWRWVFMYVWDRKWDVCQVPGRDRGTGPPRVVDLAPRQRGTPPPSAAYTPSCPFLPFTLTSTLAVPRSLFCRKWKSEVRRGRKWESTVTGGEGQSSSHLRSTRCND